MVKVMMTFKLTAEFFSFTSVKFIKCGEQDIPRWLGLILTLSSQPRGNHLKHHFFNIITILLYSLKYAHLNTQFRSYVLPILAEYLAQIKNLAMIFNAYVIYNKLSLQQTK